MNISAKMLIDLFYISLFLIILIIFLKINISNEISYKTTLTFKGIAAYIVLVHHIAQQINTYLFLKVGYLAVGIFFFVSGYGLNISYISKGKPYLRKIIFSKIPKIVLISFFTIILNLVFFNLIGEKVTYNEIIGLFRGNRLLNWYFVSIIMKYFLFYISAKISNSRKEMVIILFLLIGIYTVVCYKLDLGVHWYISSYCFLWGIFYAYNTIDFKSRSIAFIFLITFIYSNYINLERSFFTTFIKVCCLILSSLTFTILFVNLMKFKSNLIFEKIGKISAEVILLQNIAFSIVRNQYLYIENSFIYSIMVILSLGGLIICLKPIYKKLSG